MCLAKSFCPGHPRAGVRYIPTSGSLMSQEHPAKNFILRLSFSVLKLGGLTPLRACWGSQPQRDILPAEVDFGSSFCSDCVLMHAKVALNLGQNKWS